MTQTPLHQKPSKLERLPKSDRWIRTLFILTSALLFTALMMGYVVRFNGSSLTCPDWPTCYGQLALPVETSLRLELAHRALAGLATVFVFVATILVFARKLNPRWTSTAMAAASISMAAQVAVGRAVVVSASADWLGPVHLSLSLLAMGLVSAAAVGIHFASAMEGSRPASRRLGRFEMTALAGAAIVFALMFSGALSANLDAGSACTGWPLCAGGLPQTAAGWLALLHRIVTLASAVLIASLVIQAWRQRYRSLLTLSAATAAGVMLGGQIFIGALKVTRDFPADLVGLHAASAAGLWTVMVVLAAAALLEKQSYSGTYVTHEPRLKGLARAKAFVALNKPIIVALLLVTTYAGMVVGGKQIPGFWLTIWTLIGGALAAGGASALNQYIDRDIDGQMQRTAKRPLPSGRLTPAEALAYGIAACLAAFFLLAGTVNLLAAVLSLAGMIYYVLLYSILLKKATVQNIVIGGGAGAIPPLVGWAAATGSLNIPSLFLFALVFMWTPPHFWALALVRSKDYARAGVPMLPVIKGEKITRTQIFIYTLELVALTILMPVFNVTGSLFLVVAAALGLWLIYTAWNVLRKPGNKVAYRMYRYSSMYLAFIFLALVVDVLI